MKLKYAIFALVLSAVSAHAFGQTKVSYYSQLAKNGQLPAQCTIAGNALLKGLDLFPHPATWTYVVICDDASWTQVMKLQGICDIQHVHGNTNPETKTTFFRGTTLRGEDKYVTAEHVIAHELAHVYLNSRDEIAVEAKAIDWLQYGANTGTVASK